MTACLLAIATGPAAAMHGFGLRGFDDRRFDDRGEREVRVTQDEDTRCVTEERVSRSSFSIRTVCVSPPPEERSVREVRTRSNQDDASDGSARRDLGFSLQDNFGRDLGFRWVR